MVQKSIPKRQYYEGDYEIINNLDDYFKYLLLAVVTVIIVSWHSRVESD